MVGSPIAYIHAALLVLKAGSSLSPVCGFSLSTRPPRSSRHISQLHIISHEKLDNVALSLPRYHLANNWSPHTPRVSQLQSVATPTDRAPIEFDAIQMTMKMKIHSPFYPLLLPRHCYRVIAAVMPLGKMQEHKHHQQPTG